MKNTKTKTEPDHGNHVVNYQWTGADGAICHSHTVAAGRSRADAEKRFFKQNRHVLQDAADYAFD